MHGCMDTNGKQGDGAGTVGILTDAVLELICGELAMFRDGRAHVAAILKGINGRAVSGPTVTKAIKAARELNLQRMKAVMDPVGQAERAMAVYVACLQDEHSSWKDKMAAIDGYNALLQLAKHKTRNLERANVNEVADRLRDLIGGMDESVSDQ